MPALPEKLSDVNYEDVYLVCEDCSERIESAYGDPDSDHHAGMWSAEYASMRR